MNMNRLGEYGINGAAALKRCMGDQTLYHRLLTMFLNDDCYERMVAACERGDRAAMFECAHELKGMSGSLDLTDLSLVVRPLVECLRDERCVPGDVSQQLRTVGEAVKRVREGITRALAE